MLSNKRFSEFIKSEKANIASTVQNFVEISVTSIIKNAMEEFDCKNICLGGGLFLNCLTNQKIIEQCAPKNMFILPATGDDGQAIGCAYYAYHHLFGETKADCHSTVGFFVFFTGFHPFFTPVCAIFTPRG